MTLTDSIFSSYQTQSPDTTIEVEKALFTLWRSWSLVQRATNLNQNTNSARSLAWHLTQTTLNTHNKTQQIYYFLRKVLESDCLDLVHIQENIKMIGVIEETLIVAQILESLEIPYLVGGSLASGIWGEMRYTQDIDLVVEMESDQIESFFNAFSPRFYLSELAMREAIKLGQSFNLIDNQTGWKIDIFILTKDPFKQSRFQRRQKVSVNEKGEKLNFSTAEDTILQKLLWYGMTEKKSTQQWRDILGILKLQQSALDLAYLHYWANYLNLTEDLQQAFQESQ